MEEKETPQLQCTHEGHWRPLGVVGISEMDPEAGIEFAIRAVIFCEYCGEIKNKNLSRL